MLVILAPSELIGGMNKYSTVFQTPRTEHWCDAWVDQDCSQFGLSSTDCIAAKRNASIPQVFEDGKFNGYEKCRKYDVADMKFEPEVAFSNVSIIDCDEGWIYSTGREEKTLITEFDLVCSRSSYPEILQSLFFAGYLGGSLGFGVLSDRIGRQKSLTIAFATNAAAGILGALSINFWMFAISRTLLGASNIAAVILSFVYLSEVTGPSKRAFAVNLVWSSYALSYGALAGLAYIIPNWKVLTLTIAIPYIPLALLFFFVPESPRWLISKKMYKDAEKVIQKMSVVNKRELPLNYMEGIIKQSEDSPEEDSGGILDLLKSSVMRLRMLNLMFNWFVQSLVYYGLSLSTSDLGVNNYIAFSLSGLIEIPAYIFCMYMPDIFGRRSMLMLTMIGGGIACYCTILIPPGIMRVVVATIGKFGISASFALVYVISGELLPTPIRNVGIGACSIVARISGIICPIILLLKDTWKHLPVVVFGSSALLAGLLVVFLPETKGKALPQTIEEAENIGRHLVLSVDNKTNEDEEKM